MASKLSRTSRGPAASSACAPVRSWEQWWGRRRRSEIHRETSDYSAASAPYGSGVAERPGQAMYVVECFWPDVHEEEVERPQVAYDAAPPS
jgi:hypothetical protein